MKTDTAKQHELAAFRMPKDLRTKARAHAKATDLTFSQLMRRALRKELETTAPVASR